MSKRRMIEEARKLAGILDTDVVLSEEAVTRARSHRKDGDATKEVTGFSARELRQMSEARGLGYGDGYYALKATSDERGWLRIDLLNQALHGLSAGLSGVGTGIEEIARNSSGSAADAADKLLTGVHADYTSLLKDVGYSLERSFGRWSSFGGCGADRIDRAIALTFPVGMLDAGCLGVSGKLAEVLVLLKGVMPFLQKNSRAYRDVDVESFSKVAPAFVSKASGLNDKLCAGVDALMELVAKEEEGS